MNSSAPRNSRLCKASRPAGVSREFVHVCQAIGSRTEFIAADTHCRVSIGASQYVPPDHQFQRDLLIQADWPVEGHFQYATRIKLLRGTEQDAFAADIQRADCRFAPPHRRIKRPPGYAKTARISHIRSPLRAPGKTEVLVFPNYSHVITPPFVIPAGLNAPRIGSRLSDHYCRANSGPVASRITAAPICKNWRWPAQLSEPISHSR